MQHGLGYVSREHGPSIRVILTGSQQQGGLLHGSSRMQQLQEAASHLCMSSHSREHSEAMHSPSTCVLRSTWSDAHASVHPSCAAASCPWHLPGSSGVCGISSTPATVAAAAAPEAQSLLEYACADCSHAVPAAVDGGWQAIRHSGFGRLMHHVWLTPCSHSPGACLAV
jgi:hypothetical protein